MKFYFRIKSNKGFTLIEMMIAVPLFLIIATAASGAYLSLAHVDRYARATRANLDSLELVVEDMVRTIRTGSQYFCWDGTPPISGSFPATTLTTLSTARQDCTNGNTALSFIDSNGKRVIYFYGSGPNGTGLYKRWYYKNLTTGLYDSETQALVISTSIALSNVNTIFQVRGAGAAPGDTVQPYAMIHLKGSVNMGVNDKSIPVNMQGMAVQRNYDGP